jgi:flavin reductase (DIM6/NTAB) family NADH-FMN oxidoreductase RutF
MKGRKPADEIRRVAGGERDMSKVVWKEGNMLYPAPAVLVSCGDKRENFNLITIAWAGNICTDPAMTFISIRPSRLSYDIIKRTREFVINLTTKELVFAVDFCGVKSGREINKFKKLNLTPVLADKVAAPLLEESPINIECRVTGINPLGSHDMFIAEVLCIHADKKFIDRKGALHLERAEPICYSHGKYYALGELLGHFGFSVKKAAR